MSIVLIACIEMDNGIGDKDGRLLFKLREDMEHFKKTTTNKTVVFGRKTVDSLPSKKPLPNRANILMTRNKEDNNIDGFEIADNIEYILSLAKEEDIYICGGGEIYEQFMPYASKMILTHIHEFNFNARTFFPDYSHKEWKMDNSKAYKSSCGVSYAIAEYNRIT